MGEDRAGAKQQATTLSMVPGAIADSIIPLDHIGIRYQNIADDAIQLMTGRNELAKRAPGWAERIKFLDRQAPLSAGTPEVVEFSSEFALDLLPHRFINPRANHDVARVESHLPRVRRGNDQISSNELAPVHVVAKSSRQQTGAIPSLAEYAIRFLQYSNA